MPPEEGGIAVKPQHWVYLASEAFAVSPRLREDAPTDTVYSPGSHCQSSLASSNTAVARGSISTVTVLLSPGFSITRCHPASRRNFSPETPGSCT